MKIKIEKLIYGGFGMGCINGKPIFVKKSVPGDVNDITIIKSKKSYAEAIIDNIISPSEQRIVARCKYFKSCGGCDYQCLCYSDQLKYKQEIFQEVLDRAHISITAEPIIAGSDQPFFYRNSIRFFFIHNPDNSISFGRKYDDNSSGLVKIDSCLLQSEESNKILKNLKQYINNNIDDKRFLWQIKIRQGKATNEFMIEIITSSEYLPNKEGIVNCLKKIKGIKSIYHTIAPSKSLINLRRILLFGSAIIFEKIGSFRFQISPESFFQTNSLGIKKLYDTVKKYADVKIGDQILDLFCGTGSIGIYLSALAKEICGVESVESAVRDARDNAKLNKVHNIQFYCSDVLKFLSKTKNKSYDVIILDPPRAGLNHRIIDKISKLSFKKIIYVSCNPSTFARDINLFKDVGLNLVKVVPVDMFPQTHHIECIGLIIKKLSTG